MPEASKSKSAYGGASFNWMLEQVQHDDAKFAWPLWQKMKVPGEENEQTKSSCNQKMAGAG